ncbi:MAG: LysR family transcriptional regulator [Parasphingorhabdus sp.]
MHNDRLLLGETLLAVLEVGSFSEAAGVLGVGQSTVSRRIAALEQRLGGISLFRRGTRWIEPTLEAEAYAQSVREAFAQLEAAEARIADTSPEPRGVLRISLPPALGRAKFAIPLARLADKHPELSLKLDFSEGYVDLRESQVDIAIRLRSFEQTGLIAEKLGESTIGVFASPGYLAAAGAELKSLANLAHHRIIGLSSFFDDKRPRRPRPGRSAMTTLRPWILSNDLAAIRLMIVEGAGVGFLPDYLVAEDVRIGALIRCGFSPPIEAIEIIAMYPYGLRGSPRIEAALSAIKSVKFGQ